jgi:hypothetical protein
MFENRALKRISDLKKDETTEGHRELHNEELHDFYTPPNIIRISSE